MGAEMAGIDLPDRDPEPSVEDLRTWGVEDLAA